MFKYDKAACDAAKVLDKYDFAEDVCICKRNNISDYDLYKYLEDKYPKEVEEALDNLSPDELRDYMTARYNVQWREELSYTMYNC